MQSIYNIPAKYLQCVLAVTTIRSGKTQVLSETAPIALITPYWSKKLYSCCYSFKFRCVFLFQQLMSYSVLLIVHC